jgi:hypothetical protein
VSGKCECQGTMYFKYGKCHTGMPPHVVDFNMPDLVMRHGFMVGGKVTLRETSVDG